MKSKREDNSKSKKEDKKSFLKILKSCFMPCLLRKVNFECCNNCSININLKSGIIKENE